jgi:cytochrome c biogenesis protein CcmG/thiol:disulfide interchange protein DsbE
MRRRWWLAAPLIVFALFLLAVGWRLNVPPDASVRSRLVGQPMPEFSLAAATLGRPALRSADLIGGGPKLVNLFASWCVPCVAEAPVLGELKQRGVTIHGIAIRDAPADVADFLRDHGDPYRRIGADPRSRVQMTLGSSGVPESFVVDGGGVIRYQHIGPIMPQDVPEVMAELEKAR